MNLPPIEVLLESLRRSHRGDTSSRREGLLDDLMEHPSYEVATALVVLFDRELDSLWRNGWQPADLMRLVTRDRGKAGAGMLRRAIAWQAADYAQWGAAVCPLWMGQLDEISASPGRDPRRPWPLQMRKSLRDAVRAGIEVVEVFGYLPALPRLVPPPYQWPELARRGPVAVDRIDPGLLTKIRALLAKAESTEFEGEADAFTAKAQELMTRYRIDRATVAADSPTGDAVGRRIGVDDPYARAKAMLLGGIAVANGCRSVWSKSLGFATVFGQAEDLDGVEELYTSLLVQATSALQREGSKRDEYGGNRTARFRRAFLVGFADRISQRLKAAADETVEATAREVGSELVHLLDAREQAAEEALRSTYSKVGRMTVSVSDGEGYWAGSAFADRADLRTGPDPHLAPPRRADLAG